MNTTDLDCSRVPDNALREVCRLAESCLDGTITLAIAADQRATAFTGIFGGASVALLAAVATLVTDQPTNWPLALAALAAAVFLFAGAIVCAIASRPINFHVGGYEPKEIVPVVTDESWLIRHTIEDIQRRINKNRSALVRHARWTTAGLWLAALSIPAGGMPIGLALLCPTWS